MSFSTLVRLNNISVLFGKKKVLECISISFKANRIYSIIGPNGAGKSTLIKCIIGLQAPSSGSIEGNKNCRIGYVPQSVRINEHLPLSVHRFLRLTPKASLNEITEALSVVKAEHLLESSMQTLSNGEMQRVLLANALLKKPQLLVLDEPAQGVDINGQLALYRLIAELKDKLNCTLIMVSHDLHFVMAKTDEVICLHHRLCCTGAPELIASHPEYLARFGDKAQEILALYQHQHALEKDRFATMGTLE